MSTEPLVYLKGKTIPASQAHVAIYDAAVVIGATVTDLIRTFNHKPFRMKEHLERFYRSCRYARIMPEIGIEELTKACEDLMANNAKLIRPEDDLAVVLFISPGEFSVYAGSAGATAQMRPTLCIHTFPLAFQLWAPLMTQGVHVVTPSIRHVPNQCTDPKIKCRSRMHWWLADQETHLVDPKAVSLLLDLDGNVTETGGSNFLLVRNGAVLSPMSRSILPGISILTVREICGKLGIAYIEQDLQVHDVINADEAMLATTPYCLAPVTKINGLPIGDGKPGKIFQGLMAEWSRMVGLDIVKQVTTVRT